MTRAAPPPETELRRQLAAAEEARETLARRNRELQEQVRAMEALLAEAAEPAQLAIRAEEPPPPAAVASDAAPQPPAEPIRAGTYTPPEPVFPDDQPARPAMRPPAAQRPVPVRNAGGAVRYRPMRPAEASGLVRPAPAPAQEDALAQAVRALRISGYRSSGAESLVIIEGRTYRVGEMVDPRHRLRFDRIEPGAIVFSGPAGAEYRYQL